MNKQEQLGVSYARGFINKMAEAGVPEQASIQYLQKRAQVGLGAVAGGALGALMSRPEKKVDKDGNEKVKYHRLRNFILGALLGGATGAAGGAAYRAWTPAGKRLAAKEEARRSMPWLDKLLGEGAGAKIQETVAANMAAQAAQAGAQTK